jgi:hypothetical protein
MMRRFLFASVCCWMTVVWGCGGGYSESRVPANAEDTSDPTKVNMGTVEPGGGIPKRAAPGAPGN